MTDSEIGERTAGRGATKRTRLIAAAAGLLHEQGVERTTLADIAAAADVPLGNLYYYFKTKDEIVSAVIAAHAAVIRDTLAGLERHRTPKARLRALVRLFGEQRDLAAQSGCPHGTLCSELDKRHDGLDAHAAELIAIPLDWAEAQFRALGRRDARDLAVALVAAYQGASLLTNTFGDPEIMRRETARLERWLEGLG
jgi:TetR/AcrR family transcriptional repressor of nem operon